MSFKDEILTNIRTPEEVQRCNDELVIKEYRDLASTIAGAIKWELREAAYNGEYEEEDGGKCIKLELQLIPYYSNINNPVCKRYIENRKILSLIGLKYDSKWKCNFLGETKEIILTYNVFIKEESKYKIFMEELNKLLSDDEISVSLKMAFARHYNCALKYVDFPGKFSMKTEYWNAENDSPSEWVKFFMIVEMHI